MPFLDRFAWLRGLGALACIVLALLLPFWYLAIVVPQDLLNKQPILGAVLFAVAFFFTFLGIGLYFAVQGARGHRRKRERIFLLEHSTPSKAPVASQLPGGERADTDVLLSIVWRTNGVGPLRRMLDYVMTSAWLGMFALLSVVVLGMTVAQLRSATPASTYNLWPFMLTTLLFLPGSALAIHGTLMGRLYKPVAISATTSGLKWQPFWGRSRFIPWTEMRLLETSDYYSSGSVPHYHGSFTLYSRDTSIRWNDALASRCTYAQLDQLLTLIHECTGLRPQCFKGTATELHDVETLPQGSPSRQRDEMEEPMLRTFTGRIAETEGALWQTVGITLGWVLFNVLTAVFVVLYPPTAVPLYNWLILISLAPFTIVMAYRGATYLKQPHAPRPPLHAGTSPAVANAKDTSTETEKELVLDYRASRIGAVGALALGMLLLVDAPPPLDVWLFRGRYPGGSSVFVPGGNRLVVAVLLSLSAFAAIVLILSAIIVIIRPQIIVVLADDRSLTAFMPLAKITIPWESVSSITTQRWLGRTRWYVVTADAVHTVRWPAGGLILPPPAEDKSEDDKLLHVSPDLLAEYASQRTGLPIQSHGML